MDSNRWHKVKELFEAALLRPADERPAFLNAHCNGDEELRCEVESLLSFSDDEENFLEHPAVGEVAEIIVARNEKLGKGLMLGHYEIISQIGTGGMGEVYLARDKRLDRRVAVKILNEQFSRDESNLDRFIREAKAASTLSHPNILVIHEIGESGTTKFIVSEYVEGETLRQIIGKEALKPSEILDIAAQIANALATAHSAKIIHRDIKPENIMIRPDGLVKILDFGLAKLIEQKAFGFEESTVRQNQTAKGLILGTINYMSPEQAKGKKIDERTDIFSFGVLLYEMITGKTPFAADSTTETIDNLLNKEPLPLARFVPDAPDELQRIVSKTLRKNADERYQTMKGILSDLKELREKITPDKKFDRTGAPDTQATGVLRTVTADVKRQTGRWFGGKLEFPSPAILLASALILLTLIFGFWYFGNFSKDSASVKPIGSIAVLPLENLSGDTAQEYLADGVTEELITDLAKVSDLRVISRPAVMQYKDTRKPASVVAKELNVDAVLTGSVLRSSERLRITVQLIRAGTDGILWSDSYERDMRDALALQGEITQNIIGKIRSNITPQEKAQFGSTRPVNPQAYEDYLRGRFYANRQTKDDNETAIKALERAVAADPTFAPAYAELSQAYVWKLFLFAPEEKELAEKAFVAVEKALSLDPNLAVAHLARGRLLWTPANHFPHEKAVREYQRALALNPHLDEARNQLALVYCHIGAFDEAIKESQKAITTNPNNNLAQFRIGETLNWQGKHEQALSVLRAVPKKTNPVLVENHIILALIGLGRKEEAAAALEQFIKDYPNENRGLFASLQAIMAASAGQESIAEEKIKLAVERGKGFGHFHHTAYQIASAYALINKPEQAVKWLETTAVDGFPCYPLFENDINLNPIRQNPKFKEFLSDQKRQWEYYKTLPQL